MTGMWAKWGGESSTTCVNMFAPHLWTRVSLAIDPCICFSSWLTSNIAHQSFHTHSTLGPQHMSQNSDQWPMINYLWSLTWSKSIIVVVFPNPIFFPDVVCSHNNRWCNIQAYGMKTISILLFCLRICWTLAHRAVYTEHIYVAWR